MNGFTLPLATWAYGEWGWNYFVVEGAVILTEALILAGFWKMNLLRAGGISLLSNGFSALVGLLLTPNGFALVFHLA
ncbi:MAG: hypothetical protein H6581_22970 [Bacteroidia bacterium]|nr:hypothetical protein [Bacteroidia bacterium]